ncbi:MAG: DUF805 domain-containing protein [Clostridiales bacterium]|nr:DUF805 domain-containing protein [Clostridiales bacterium]
MRGLSFLFWLSFLDRGDLAQFVGEIFRVKDGCLTRKQFYIGQIIVYTIMLLIITPVLLIIWFNHPSWLPSSESMGTKMALTIAYITITPVQLSAFMRRMNDAAMTKWLALVLAFPIVGNVLATVLGVIFPTNYGVERYY